MKLTLILALLLVITMQAGDDDIYNGPSEEDVIVLDKDNL